LLLNEALNSCSGAKYSCMSVIDRREGGGTVA